MNSESLMALAAAQVRERLAAEYPGLDLSLPTVEVFCRARARAIALNDYAMDIAEGRKAVKVRGGRMETGPAAVPPYIWGAISSAEASSLKAAQDLGLDLTGRAKALKDNAIRQSLVGASGVAELEARGRRLRAVRELPASERGEGAG